MSLMNHDGVDYIHEKLFIIAKQTRKNEISIDLLKEEIEPADFKTESISRCINRYNKYFSNDLESQKCSLDHVKEVKINIIFDLEKTTKSNRSDLDLPSYVCTVEILDDRNVLHKANVTEWWNY
jgi:hypothetical protein